MTEKWDTMKRKIMIEVVATNIVASQPPERQPTGTPTATCMLSRVYQGNLKGILKKCSRVPQWSVNGDPSKF